MADIQGAVNEIHRVMKTDYVLTVFYMGKRGYIKRKYYMSEICRLLGAIEAAKGVDLVSVRDDVVAKNPESVPLVPIDHTYSAEYVGKTPVGGEDDEEPVGGIER